MLLLDPSADFGTIAQREKLAERHVRFLAPLAYLSPRVVEAIAEGRAPADLAVRRLARKPSLDWAEQAVALDGWRAHLRQFTFNRTGLRESRTSVGRTGSRDSETPKSALQIEAGKRDR